MASWRRCGEPCLSSRVCAQKPVLQCKVEFRGADRTVMAASCLCLRSWLTQPFCDLHGNDGRSQWNCCVNVMFGRWKSHEPLCFLAPSGSWRRCGEPCLSSRVCAQKPVLQCKVEFRGADRSGMAASFMCIFAALFDIVLVGLQGSDCRSQWNCCVRVMFGR